MRKCFWNWVESDLPTIAQDESPADALIVQSDRLRQRTGRACIWIALLVGIAWAVVLAPHCVHLMSHPEWSDAKASWLVVSAPPVALIAALLGMAERFFTPAHILHRGKKNADDTADEFGRAMGAGGEAVKNGLGKLVENAIK